MNNYPTINAAVVPGYRESAKIPEGMTIDQNGQIPSESGTGNWYLIPLKTKDPYDKLPDLTTIPVMNGSMTTNVLAYKYSADYYISAMSDELWKTFTTVTKQVIKSYASDCGCSGGGTTFMLGEEP